MDIVQSWGDVFGTAMLNLWVRLLDTLPNIIGAVVILLLGLWIASILSRFIGKIVRMTKVDNAVSRIDAIRNMDKMGWHVMPSFIIEWFVKWYFIVVTLITVADLLGWTQITEFLNAIIAYIPNVVVAVVVLVVGFLAAQFVNHFVVQSMKHANNEALRRYVPMVSKWAIIVFAFMAALSHLGVARNLIEILFTGIIVAISLALGLSFGLGGRDHAKKVLDQLS